MLVSSGMESMTCRYRHPTAQYAPTRERQTGCLQLQEYYLHVRPDRPGRLASAQQSHGCAAAGMPTLDCL